MRRLTNSRDRSVLPRSILLLFLSPFLRFFLHKIAGIRCPPPAPWGTSSLRSRGAQSESSLHPFFFTSSDPQHALKIVASIRMAPELDKILLRKKKMHVVLDVHLHVRPPFSLLWSPRSFFSPPPTLRLGLSAGVNLAGVNLTKERNRRARKNNV